MPFQCFNPECPRTKKNRSRVFDTERALHTHLQRTPACLQYQIDHQLQQQENENEIFNTDNKEDDVLNASALSDAFGEMEVFLPNSTDFSPSTFSQVHHEAGVARLQATSSLTPIPVLGFGEQVQAPVSTLFQSNHESDDEFPFTHHESDDDRKLPARSSPINDTDQNDLPDDVADDSSTIHPTINNDSDDIELNDFLDWDNDPSAHNSTIDPITLDAEDDQSSIESNNQPSNQTGLVQGTLLKETEEKYTKVYNEHIKTTTEGHKHGLELIERLVQKNVSLDFYDEILQWAKDAHVKGLLNDNQNSSRGTIPTKKPLMDKIMKLFSGNDLRPKIVQVHLPNAKCKVNVTLNSIEAAVISLLEDKELMKAENLLLYDVNNLTQGPPNGINFDSLEDIDDAYIFKDINTGRRFITAWHQLCAGDRHMLVPLIIFIDKTHTDAHGKLVLEPVSMTLGIFNWQTRLSPQAWRSLGTIPNESTYHTANSSLGKVSDWHVMVKVITDGIRRLSLGSWEYDLKYDEQQHSVVLRMPLLYIIGDTEGHDKMCGHYNCRTDNVPGLCRYCNTPFHQTDNPNFSFKKTNYQDLSKKKESELNQLGYHKLTHGNAFDGIVYGDKAATKAGINGATPHELLHVTQQGQIQRAKECLFDEHKQTADMKENAAANDFDEESMEKQAKAFQKLVETYKMTQRNYTAFSTSTKFFHQQ